MFRVPDPELGSLDCPQRKRRHEHVAAVHVCIDNQGTSFGMFCFVCNTMHTAEEMVFCNEEHWARSRVTCRAKQDPVGGYFDERELAD